MLRAIHYTLLTLLLGSPAYGNSLSNLADEVIKIRAEIEALHNEIDQKKETAKSEIQSLNLIKSDLEAGNQRLEMNIKQVAEKTKKAQVTLQEQFSSKPELIAFLNQSMDDLAKKVEVSLPFKKTERLAAIEDIRGKLAGQKLSPLNATSKVWSFVEDEIRLQKDIGLYKETLNINGSSVLADVAKIGMFGFYYRTPDGKYGVISRSQDEWKRQDLTADKDKQEVDLLFDQLKKQIRVGKFSLPKFI
ncbi:MAG: DUF3450 family protein [Pseudobacteriovorax sp.]|nr:DUF3450 family protein [Pseudobacteriovorax sp.]